MQDKFTITELVQHFKPLGVNRGMLDYALRTYGPEPTGRVGLIRVWDASALPEIQNSLNAVAANNTRRAAIAV